jgi:hypothetical protein
MRVTPSGRRPHSRFAKLYPFILQTSRRFLVKKIVWLIAGIGLGFLVAHQFSRTEKGAEFFDGVDSKAREFSAAVIDGYKAREAELRAAVADAEDAIADLTNRRK